MWIVCAWCGKVMLQQGGQCDRALACQSGG